MNLTVHHAFIGTLAIALSNGVLWQLFVHTHMTSHRAEFSGISICLAFSKCKVTANAKKSYGTHVSIYFTLEVS